jgi:hypothetical protein
MPKLRIAIVAVVALAVLCLAFVVATSKRAPVLTVRVVEVTNAGGTLNVALQITYTNAPGLLLLPRLETCGGILPSGGTGMVCHRGEVGVTAGLSCCEKLFPER